MLDIASHSTVVGEDEDGTRQVTVAGTPTRYARDVVNWHARDLLTICEKKRQRGQLGFVFPYDGDITNAHQLMAAIMDSNKFFIMPDVDMEGEAGHYVIKISWPPLPPLVPKIPRPRKNKASDLPEQSSNNNNTNKRVKVEDINVL